MTRKERKQGAMAIDFLSRECPDISLKHASAAAGPERNSYWAMCLHSSRRKVKDEVLGNADAGYKGALPNSGVDEYVDSTATRAEENRGL